MYICVWKRMPQMNDNLIVRIAVIWACFLSIWMALSGFTKGDKAEQFCIGDYQVFKSTFDWQEIVAPTPYDLPR